MSPERHFTESPPPLATDFAQRVLRQAKRVRRRNSMLRTFGLGASLAVVALVVRPAHLIPNSQVAVAFAASDFGEEVSDSADSDEGDPGSFFFPDASADAQLTAEAQSVTDDDLPDTSTDIEGSDE